jgi:putative MFS transporter
MSVLVADGALLRTATTTPIHAAGNAQLVARLERLPVTPRLMLLRVIVGIATFFDAYTVLAIAFAMPQLVSEWKLTPTEVGIIISAGYVGQLFGAVLFGSLAEKIGRLKTLFITIVLFVSMDIACLFAWSGVSMMAFRFFQGVGTGGEVPVASAYINEFIGAEKRGRFFLLYEVIFPIGLMFAGMAGYFLVPIYGWQAMFIVGLIPSVLTIPLRWFMPESPRWLASKGRIAEADAVVKLLEDDAMRRGSVLREPVVRPLDGKATAGSDWRELFKGIYLKRTLTIWGLWVCVYMINNGLVTWLPTHPLQAGVSAAPADEPRLRLDHLGRRCHRVHRLRAVDRQGRPKALVRGRILARRNTAPDAVLARRRLGHRDTDPGDRRLRYSSDHRLLALSLFCRTLSNASARGRHRLW